MNNLVFTFFSTLPREYIFSEENLCMDTFIRAYMDEAGYVPIALVCSYQNVACFGIPLPEIIDKLKSQELSRLEIDEVNETIKLKEKWDMVRSRSFFLFFAVLGLI